jgi:hypothetical protein
MIPAFGVVYMINSFPYMKLRSFDHGSRRCNTIDIIRSGRSFLSFPATPSKLVPISPESLLDGTEALLYN